jgi:hypothetical protein
MGKELLWKTSLKEAYEKLASEYPSSEWAKKAALYRLL